ncbi:uncharacterized protein LOC107633714 isoform X1 [Arachis ipaensis]|uniref:USP domain-containing protein n=1 Tax=Arachis hypogaea TaxID=3818 RepID=A0A445B094_ARAHY|nr:uncharacterized protein LOC107633714 isoform X1 [Arachis ipaensis]XP_025629235.1 uncharacterized protein LOC112722437 isoform X1 [Arachis hypogaea]QHO20483.1 Inactive ubiquitin carboxyl-terminal hydrolase [Arachis hypogaea]RYR32060.1 hypothetical protein Ahy_B01g057056 [Arachis hypogaea]
MGHKKRNSAPRSKHSPATSPAAQFAVVGDGTASPEKQDSGNVPDHNSKTNNGVQNPNGIEFPPPPPPPPPPPQSDGPSSDYTAIKLECERALTAFRRGNHNRALKLMKELCGKQENAAHSAFAHRVQGFVAFKVAGILNDPTAKQRHVKNAVDSARKAVELCPNSVEYAHFYANLMLEVANDGKDYEEVVQECERALAIENPSDPGKESFQDESDQKLSTPEARVSHVQNELRQLIQKSNIASLSSWVKNLSNGEERFRLIPIRRPTEDPMELRLVQTRRPNEIKKVTKTPEERRKEIEVRVAAARLLQQKSESPQSPNEVDKDERGLDSSSAAGQSRRRHGNSKKNGSTAERRKWVQSYWSSMSVEMKKDMLRVRVSDLRSHFGSSKDTLPIDLLAEAVSYAEANKTWKFWVCCHCDEKFNDDESHSQHLAQAHMGMLSPNLQGHLPHNVDSEWIDMIHNCSWKPLDVSAAVKMLESRMKFKGSSLVEDSYFDHHTQDYYDCINDATDPYHEKEGLEYSLHNCTTESNNYCKAVASNVREGVENQLSMSHPFADSWPVSDDSERAKLLEKIHAVFEMLIKHKYLAASHLSKVIQFTMGEIQGLAAGSQFLNHGVDQTPMCICFLGASQLKKILQFLQELSHACGLGRYGDKGNGLMNEFHDINQGPEIKENIVLNGDASCLLLDECLLVTQVTFDAAQGTVLDNMTAQSSHDGISSDNDDFLSWIYSGSAIGDQLTSWMRTKEDNKHQGTEIIKMLDKEFYQLQTLCEKKSDRMSYEEALQTVEDLCLEEGKKREIVGDFVQQSYESVLRKRREELIESENDVMNVGNRFELDAISNVLQEAESMNVNQFGYEETYAGVTAQLCDLESGEEEEWRMKDYLHQMDGCIEIAIQKLKEHLSIELSKIDARIIRNIAEMQQLELKLGPLSAYDYRAILLPLVKSYLRARLEEFAEKDAVEKSDAAREAFLAELARDAKKAKGGSENTRNVDKTKDKKKTKDHRKTKDLKASSGHEELSLQASSPDSNTVAPDSYFQDPELVSMNDNYLEQQEEEYRRKIELEEEEKKLEETLEFQRRIENEAKQKHLAELQKKSSGICLEEVADKIQDAQLKTVADGTDVHDHVKLPIQEQSADENCCPSDVDSVIVTTKNGSLVPNKYSVDSADQKILHQPTVKQAGIPNGVVPENGHQLPDRRPGKKHKRHRNSSKMVDGKLESVSLEKNIEDAHTDRHSREHVKFHNDQDANNGWESNVSKAKKDLQMEDEEEERFQADLKKAVRQSLDTYQARGKLPLDSSLRMSQRSASQVDSLGFPTEKDSTEDANGTTLLGTGLKNEVGEYNCFLNVIIQSLWHLRRFREEFLGRSRSEHDHVGNPCVVCALYEIFTALDLASKDSRREAVAPTSLRIALSNLYPDSNFFQEAQMNDASEVLAVIFDCLHRSFTRGSSVSDTESVESNCMGSWDCANNTCIAHSLFGMDIFEQMNCYHCGLESRHLKYTSFFHNINANALRTMKVMCSESSFDELLNLVEMNHQLACDPEVGGCGKLNYIHHFLSTPPHVFMTVLGWQNTCESADDITATVAALSTALDISVLYRGLDPKRTHSLVSVVCYYGQHYHCFAYSHDHDQWIMYDDKTVKIIGGWADVLTMCEKGHLQPQVLFFEAVN